MTVADPLLEHCTVVKRDSDLVKLSSCRRFQIALLTLLVGALASVGCQTTRTINASQLPPRFDIGSKAYKPAIDLSRLARRSLNNDLVYPGDVLDVTVTSGAEERPPEPQPLRVDPHGNLNVPEVGMVRVAGLSMAKAEQLIRDLSRERQIYRRPIVTVLLNSRQTDRVRIVGAVRNPGDYEVPSAANDLLAAIVAAGGLDTEAAGTTIEIRHPVIRSEGAPVRYEPGSAAEPAGSVHVDLIDAMQGTAGDLRLRDGSVVMVQERTPRTVYVTGLVAKAGEYELPHDQPLRVTQAIARAGGRKLELANTVHVTRNVPGRAQPVVVKVSMPKAKADSKADLTLAPGDVVSVEETPVTFVVDTLRNFFRFGFSSTVPGF